MKEQFLHPGRYSIHTVMHGMPEQFRAVSLHEAVTLWANLWDRPTIRACWRTVDGGQEAMYWDIIVTAPGPGGRGHNVRVWPYAGPHGSHRIRTLDGGEAGNE